MEATMNFQDQIKQGIPTKLPAAKPYPADANRAPKRKDILSVEEKPVSYTHLTLPTIYSV